MANNNELGSDEQPKKSDDEQKKSGRGQAIQINENTIDDPNPPEADPGDDDMHHRFGEPNRDQAIQINENTIADNDER